MVVYGQKRLCLDKVVVFGQSGCIRIKWLHLGKVAVFGHSGCVRAKVLVFGQGG